MFIPNALLVTLGAVIMGAGLIVIIRIVGTLQVYDLVRPWIILASLIFFILIENILTALRFLDLVMLPAVSMEALFSAIFFFGALFVLALAVPNQRLFRDILGKGINDQEAYLAFSQHIGMPANKIKAMVQDDYAVACDICGGDVHYAIPELVRTHPWLDRGLAAEQALGGSNHRFYVRHSCGEGLREIPVRHDRDNTALIDHLGLFG